MLHQILVILHLLGAVTWIGGHFVLVRVILPPALRSRDPRAIVVFEHGFGKAALAALILQIVTGAWLASTWLGGWSHLFDFSVPAAHLVLAKLGLLVATLAQAGHAFHSILPRLKAATTPEEADRPLRAFALHAWITTVLAVLFLIVGASIRLGGPL
ncbi:MAG: CopD family protein [Phycisphaerales bacterium]|nr:CopD family protein [Phycisphaerales bacterium]